MLNSTAAADNEGDCIMATNQTTAQAFNVIVLTTIGKLVAANDNELPRLPPAARMSAAA
jgi:hypothetical protein